MKYFITLFFVSVFVLQLNAAQTIYLSENFKTGAVKTSWKNIDNDGNVLNAQNALKQSMKTGEGWSVQQISQGVFFALSTSWFTTAGQADDWLITEPITIGDNVFITWEAMSGWASSGYFQSYQVLVSTTGNNIADFQLLKQIDNEGTGTIRTENLSAYAGQKIYLAFRNVSQNTAYGYLFIGNINVLTPEKNDMTLLDFELPTIGDTNPNGYTIKGVIGSMGYLEVNSYEINYSVDNGEPVTTTVSNVNINYYGSAEFEHPVKWAPSSNGSHKVKVWISKVNGVDDPVISGNDITKTIYIGSQSYYKLPLYEEFTSSTCGPCASANKYLNPYLEKNKGNYTVVKYQMNWPGSGDPYYNSDGATRRTYYGVTGVPSFFLNGVNNVNAGDTATITELSPEAGIVDVKATYRVYNEDYEDKIEVSVDVTPYFDNTTNSQFRLHVVVVENKTTKNARTNGETEFHFVEQKMLPNGNGTLLDAFVNDEVQNNKFNYTFSTSNVEEFDDLSVVVFVQEVSSKAIFGTAWATEAATSVDDAVNDGNGIVALFPNPTVDEVFLRYNVRNSQPVSIDLFNMEGQKISSINKSNLTDGTYSETINTSNFANGSYMVKLTIGEQTFSKMFVVNK